jgi:anti-sigma B factor antagonist
MQIGVEIRGDAIVVVVSGRIDHLNAAKFHDALTPHLANCCAGGTAVILDLSGLEYISSAGLRIFMIAAKQVRARGGRIAVAQLQPLVQEIFEISHFHLVYEIFTSTDDALTAVSTVTTA